eukprot:CAMPEP_0113458566 /NCGR_PEP_ID=MMETSP0014_2-20120614/9989_1 /TAXON_ID=2857 /ORGANISM="Nitzschia sp." /LENGTH=620 /DNA_ID=CAMNT_0000350095 /DNA_START=253 /DNA_END=2113 /DNA_ORIENTATION=+ /assembly_acc=CAM_ASM_000159
MYSPSKNTNTNNTNVATDTGQNNSNSIGYRPPLDKYERFEEWLRENGAVFDMLELREYDSPEAVEEDAAAAEEKKEQAPSSHVYGDKLSGEYSVDGRCGGSGGVGGEHERESEMRGVHARTHIPVNTVCVSVPRCCLITVEMGQETPIGQAILRSDLDLDAPKHIFLMVYLLWDRKVNGHNSFFHPYYEILPATLSNMPIFWTPEELDNLRGSYLIQQIQDRNDAIAEDYYSICQIAPSVAKICTLEEFKWARMCVCSRNFGLQIDGHRTSALVPHADMLNHYRPRETKWTFDEERQAFTITTLQSIPAGAQVYDSYGQKCNHRFLLNYGFAVEDNRELDGFCPNEVSLELTLSQDDHLYAQKLEFWMRGEQHHHHHHNHQKANSTTKRVRVCVSNNENTRLLFSLLRTMNCSLEELRAITAPVTSDIRSMFMPPAHHSSSISSSSSATGYYRSCRDIRHPLSLRNERMAMLNLLQIISEALGKYPTTLSQDKADLLDERMLPPFSNERHAKIQVRGEKEVLHHFARWARTALDVMEVIENELKDEHQRASGGVEVQLMSSNGDGFGGRSTLFGGRSVIVATSDETGASSSSSSRNHGFEYIIRKMEDDEDGIHHTITRY